MPRLGSRIRTVAPAFPSQGPANLAGTLSGTVIQVRRFGRNPRIRGRLGPELLDVPQHPFVLADPYARPRDSGPYTPAGLPGGGESAASPVPAAPAPQLPCNCGCSG